MDATDSGTMAVAEPRRIVVPHWPRFIRDGGAHRRVDAVGWRAGGLHLSRAAWHRDGTSSRTACRAGREEGCRLSIDRSGVYALPGGA